ncbi:MAG: PEP-CTERM sorting domain-containing protein [Phycisphaerales bacterium]|nr:PEP-CTERM sorting domain-containing protein [Phycisphaerales bacterium]
MTRQPKTTIAAFFCVIGIAAAAHGNQLTNGDFETGDLTGWTIVPTSANGTTTLQDVVMWDIDGPGPLEESFAPRFQVGALSYSGVYEGIFLFQSLTLVEDVEYLLDFDWSAYRWEGYGTNSDRGIFSIVVGDTTLAATGGGSIGDGQQITGHLSAAFTPDTTGMYRVGATITRRYLAANSYLYQNIDNFTVVPAPGTVALLGVGVFVAGRRRGEGRMK